MKFFIVASCILAGAFAFSDVAKVELTQDTAGNYRFILHDKDISREEQATADGDVVGSYGFTDKEGAVHAVNFVAGRGGYVASSADLPVAVAETEAVAKTRAHHQALVDRYAALLPKTIAEEKPVNPKEVLAKLVVPEVATLPVEFVPAEESDVVEAKKEFLRQYAAALNLLKEEYAKL